MKQNKSKILSILLVVFVFAFALTACSPGNSSETQQPGTQQSNTQSNNQSNTESNAGSENHSNTREIGEKEQTPIRVASLLGPTGMGMVKLMADQDQGEADLAYEFSLAASPDDLVAKVINKEIDVAALPTNLALLLYNRTEGQIQLAAINTLGVLYLVENGESIKSVADLKGKEVYISGKGTTPDFVIQYLLKHHGLEVGKDVQLDYFTQHSDLAAALAGGDATIGLLPQPHVTTAMLKNPDLKIALDLTKEWEQAAP
ncbi:MAG: ABC transporter substrate-binding protein, partial [Desulfitobacterium sp.]|nr:ABC transporter substrate-binding protein [Desulfitobacterium sp.]